jgi:hypothetical protein
MKRKQLDEIVTVRFDGDTAAMLRQVAKHMDLPYTQLVRLSVTRFLALPDEWQPRLEMITTHTEESG